MRIADLLEHSRRLHGVHIAASDAFGGRRTFRELAARVSALANGLGERGVSAGTRIAVLARNRVEYVELYLAASRCDAVLVPLNGRCKAAELQWILAHAQADVLVVEGGAGPAADELDVSCARVCVRLGGARDGWIAFEDLLGGSVASATRAAELHARAAALSSDANRATDRDAARDANRVAELASPARPSAREPGADLDPIAVQMYTSGTTGKPKGALLSHANLLAMTHAWRLELALAPGQCFVQITPLFHIGALLMLLSALASGARLHLVPEFEPRAVGAAIDELGATHTLLVPSMLRWWLDDPASRGTRLPTLRTLVYGAAPIAPADLARAQQRLSCGFLQGYGLTETCGVLTALAPSDHFGDPALLASAGREVACCEVRVVDASGAELAPGGIGEIVARGANVLRGYWRDEAATAEALRNGWFHTGDVGRADEHGYVYLLDRAKDLVIVGGENVYPREVEDVLATHPAVRESAVIGIPHALWGEEVLALVVPREEGHGAHAGLGSAEPPRALALELIAHCRASLARFKCPTRIEWRASLPRTPAGKLQKPSLREPYWGGRERRV